eukprot:jgi/Bigna1/89238/estExt_fgenesh1_pg.C_460007
MSEPATDVPPKEGGATADVTKTDKSDYYFFKSTPKELQKQYAPVPLKPGQQLDFTPRAQTLHESTLVKKDEERKKAEAAQKKFENGGGTNLSYSQVITRHAKEAQQENLDHRPFVLPVPETCVAMTLQIRKNAYDFRDKEHEVALEEPDKYDIGQKVVIHGLKKAAKFNDQVAEVLSEIKDGRYPVKIVESKKQLNVKRENLKMYRPVVCKEFVNIKLEYAAPRVSVATHTKYINRRIVNLHKGVSFVCVMRGFRCTPELLFKALTDQDMVSKYTQSEAKIEVKEGGGFSLFGGSIHGSFQEASPPSKIVQVWRFKEWPDDHFSTVTLEISSPEYGVTVAKLNQVEVPVHDKFRNRDVPDKVKKGWKEFFFDRIHKVVGFAKVEKSEYSRKKKAKDDEEDED